MDKLIEYLTSRGIEDTTIKKIQDDKVDPHVILAMTDTQLKEYFQKYGDRIAILDFCKKNISNATHRESLLDKLKRKINKDKSKRKIHDLDDDERSQKQNLHHRKATRIIEIGWICDGVQVRTKFGGGTRRVSMNRLDNKFDIQQKALELFFPNGISTKGHITNYDYDVVDFKHNSFPRELTIEDIYKLTSLTTLRFYLVTNRKEDDIDKPSTSGSQSVIDFEENCSPVINNNLDVESSSEFNPAFLFVFDNTVEENHNIIEASSANEIYTNNSLNGELLNMKIQLELHRGNIFSKLLEAFLNVNCEDLDNLTMEVTIIGVDGQKEAAQDGGGVSRDAISEFWETFYSKCCEGTVCKIPIISHLYNEHKWKAMAGILFVGYKQFNYFPAKLVRPFIEQVVLGEVKSEIMESFFTLIGKHDAVLLRKALDSFSDINQNELIEILYHYDCKKNITAENVSVILKEIAHTMIIQKPNYIIDCWAIVLKRNYFTENKLDEIYEQNKITNKNILKLLKFDSIKNVKEDRVSNFLLRYIREADDAVLEKFLRFATGANNITGNLITIVFNQNTGLLRVPKAHTCNCILDISSTYDSYSEFRQEVDAVFQSNFWSMDFI